MSAKNVHISRCQRWWDEERAKKQAVAFAREAAIAERRSIGVQPLRVRFLPTMQARKSTGMFKALVVEDQNLMRLALMDQLRSSLGDCVVLGAETLEIATHALQNDDFDLVVIDPGLPGFDPMAQSDRLAVVDKIIESSPSAIHIVVTGSDSSSEAEEFRQLGAAGYLGKTGLEPGVFVSVLEDISTKGFFIRLSRAAMTTPDYRYSVLTPREQEIFDMMTRRERGMKRKEIYELMAHRLSIDAATAEKYFKQARAKLMKNGHKLPKGL